MKILLLQPPSPPGMNVKRDYAGGMGVADYSVRQCYGHDRDYITLPYMSLLYSAAVLERLGHDVVFADAQADNTDLDGILGKVAEERPQILVSVINLPSIYGDIALLKAVKERFPEVVLVVTGTVTIPLYGLIAESNEVDVIIRGDPEVVLPDFMRVSASGREEFLSRVKADGKRFEVQEGVITNKVIAHIQDLDSLPRLPYHLVPVEKYRYHGFGKGVRYAAVFSSRGCSFKCYYCPYPVGFGSCIVYRDPVKVVDEIEDLKVRHGVEGILFRDQVFTMDSGRVHKLCDEMINRNLNISWVVETRLDRVDETLLRKMKQAGCARIHYGLESGDPAMFARVGKDGVEKKMETLLHNFGLTEKLGIHAHVFVLIGLLGETMDSINKTIETIRKIKPLTMQVAIVTPYPGTLLFEEADKKGLIVTKDWSQYTGFNAVMRSEALSVQELVGARQKIMNSQRKAARLKRLGYLSRLAMRYIKDGSIAGRLYSRMKT